MDTVIARDAAAVGSGRVGQGPPAILVDGAYGGRAAAPLPLTRRRLISLLSEEVDRG